MKAKIYWAIRHINQAAQDLRFMVKCWRLSQHINFLEWRMQLDATLSHSVPQPAPAIVR